MYVCMYVGGDPFDEACSCPWADLQDKLNEGPVQYPLPMVSFGIVSFYSMNTYIIMVFLSLWNNI